MFRTSTASSNDTLAQAAITSVRPAASTHREAPVGTSGRRPRHTQASQKQLMIRQAKRLILALGAAAGLLARNRLTRTAGVLLGSGAVIVATAAPALAMHRVVGAGTPGYVHGTTSVAIEGGVCGVPGETTCVNQNLDQIYVDNFRAYSAPYNTTQSVYATAYLYRYNGSSFVHYLTYNFGTCGPMAGNGATYCPFGSNAPDQGGANNDVPVFSGLPRGYAYTVVIRVLWYDSGTGALLSYADYHPNTTADINCAYYAEHQVSPPRCTGPWTYNGVTYINMP